MTRTVSLVAIESDGALRDRDLVLPDLASELLQATARLYKSVGFEEPWIGYLALEGSTVVGTCCFKSPPRDGRVEIAYCTFPELEGRGLATAMAAELVSLARRKDPAVLIAAQTLPERNASCRILEKLGFRQVETLEHPDDGTVWEWQLER